MKTPTLPEVLGKVRQIPSLSVVVAELLVSLNRDESDTATLVSKIAQDQGLAARVLRVANSPFYGLNSRVSAVSEAVVVLGFHAVRSLALAAGILNVFPPGASTKFDRLAFWRHAVGTGVCARVVAARVGCEPESAFTAGLLHDVGKLALHVYFSDVFEAVLDRRSAGDLTIAEAERELLGYDHSAIGYEIARNWRFPPQIQQAIRDHHDPDAQPSALGDVVHVANSLCIALDIGCGGDHQVPRISHAAWARLGLGWEALGQSLREIERLNAGMNLLLAE